MLQIQPVFSNIDFYTELARREGLRFELLELPSGSCGPERAAFYRGTGFTRSLHGAFIDVNPASGDLDFRELSRRKCRESCECAKACGAENVVLHSSCFPFLRGAYLEAWADGSAEFYTRLAEETGLKLFIENSMDVDPTPLTELMKRVGSPNIKVCLDIGHANYSRVAPEAWFDALGGSIGYLHLSDNDGQFDGHLPLGTGTLDLERLSRMAEYLPPETPMTLEVGGPEGILSSLAFLKERHCFGM